jgi:hypothetical protein
VVHFGLYYTGQNYFPYFVGVSVKNPGISAALGIVAALIVGVGLHLLVRDGTRLGRRRPASD